MPLLQRKILSLLFNWVGKLALYSGGGIISSLQTVCYTNVLDKVFGTKSAQYVDHKMCRSTREPRRILFQWPISPFLLLLKSQYSWDLCIHLSVPDLFLKTPYRHWYSLILCSTILRTFIYWVDGQPIHRYILRQVPVGTNA